MAPNMAVAPRMLARNEANVEAIFTFRILFRNFRFGICLRFCFEITDSIFVSGSRFKIVDSKFVSICQGSERRSCVYEQKAGKRKWRWKAQRNS